MTINELKRLRESEDKIEFKAAERNFPYAGGSHTAQEERRKCYLGYIVAFANEGGGLFVMGMTDEFPHQVIGTNFADGQVGAMEDETYVRLGIRVRIEEIYEAGLRVLVTRIPSRPLGKMFKFEGVPLMRVGESLRNMSDEEMFSILSEQEPDFSAKICEGIGVSALDVTAIRKMKDSYAHKQNNPSFSELSTAQVLTDLKLMVDGRLNYAALILLGKKGVLQQKLPQCKIIWEFRNTETQTHFDSRISIEDPLFLGIDSIWQLVNQPTLNKKYPIQNGAYIFDLYDFNEAVIREAVLNAVAHRDYTITSEVVIKQFPKKIIFNNPGGFPKGVTIDNILTVSSTPRCRLMTEVLEKTGLVERSGQGVDKIFQITLSEGKAEPDYKDSDMFQVSLTLKTEIVNKAFHIFVSQYQNSEKEPKLGVEQIITLYKIHNGLIKGLNLEIVGQLEGSGLIEKGSGHSIRYTLSKEFQKLMSEGFKIGKRYLTSDIKRFLLSIQGKELKIGELEVMHSDHLNRNQIKYLLDKLVEDEIVKVEGKVKAARYSIVDKYAGFGGVALENEVISELRKKYEGL